MSSTITKTRKFLLRPKQPELQDIPAALLALVERGRMKCANDLSFAVACLTPPASYVEFFTHHGLEPPASFTITHRQFEHAFQHLQVVAKQRVFRELYPTQFLQLLQRLSDVFMWLSQQNPEAFKETSLMSIKNHIISANDPKLQEFKAKLVTDQVLSPRDSLWKAYTFFMLVQGRKFRFSSRVIRAGAVNLFFAYRNKILADATLQLLTSYLSDRSVIPPAQLIRFFRAASPPNDITRGLYHRLKTELRQQFSGWKNCVPPWFVFLNTLRHVRNLVCEQLPDDQVYAVLQTYLEPLQRDQYAELVVNKFVSKATAQGQTLPEYFVALLMRKIAYRLRDHCLEIWHKYFYRSRTTMDLSGVPQFLYEFLATYVQGNVLSVRMRPKDVWRVIKESLKAQINQARPAFLELFSQVDFSAYASQAIEGCITLMYWEQAVDDQLQMQIRNKRRLFHPIHRTTPLQTFSLPIKGEVKADLPALQACLNDFLTARFQRQAEELIRPTLVEALLPVIREVLQDAGDSRVFVTKEPTFENPGFSLAIADKQMYELDPTSMTFSLALTTDGRGFSKTAAAHWHTFEIQDTVSHHDRKRGRQPRISTLLAEGWQVNNPTLTTHNGDLYLHIPFEKESLKKVEPLKVGKRKNTKTEVVIGVDLGVKTYATVAVMLVKSTYWRDETNKICREIHRDETEYLAHFHLKDREALVSKFDATTGRFQSGTNYDLFKRGKGKLRLLKRDIDRLQAQIMCLVTTNPTDFNAHPEYQRLRQRQADRWTKVNRLLDTISKAVAAKIRDIVVYYITHSEYSDYQLRVQVEDLRWSKHGSKTSVGSYLAQNQILFLHNQVQETLTHLLWEYGIGVWLVNPKHSSQLCAKCGYQGTRAKKDFTCQNVNHLNAKGNPYTCDADLNAAWNIALFPPRRDRPHTV